MELYQYMMLPDNDQWVCLWANGEFLTHRTTKGSKCSLYALYDFFIEVELHPKTTKIIGKSPFKEGRMLDKYAGNIDINKI